MVIEWSLVCCCCCFCILSTFVLYALHLVLEYKAYLLQLSAISLTVTVMSFSMYIFEFDMVDVVEIGPVICQFVNASCAPFE